MTAFVYSPVADSAALWDRFATSTCDDLPRLLTRGDGLPATGSHPDLHFDYSLPSFRRPWARTDANPFLVAELRYEVAEELRLQDDMYVQLNPDQRSCFDVIVQPSRRTRGTSAFSCRAPPAPVRPFSTAACVITTAGSRRSCSESPPRASRPPYCPAAAPCILVTVSR